MKIKYIAVSEQERLTWSKLKPIHPYHTHQTQFSIAFFVMRGADVNAVDLEVWSS